MTSSGGFGARTLNNMSFVGSAQLFRFVLTTLSTIIVARLLSPTDYGVMAMAAPATGLILMFQDLGLGQATVQAKVLDPEKLNGAFWMNILSSGVIAAVLLAAAPLVGWFYHDVRPAQIVAASVLPALISGAAVQHSALLNRNMRFGVISLIDVACAAVIFIVTIGAALAFRTYWALWAGSLGGAVTAAALVWHFERWRPSRSMRLKGVGDMTRFGINLTGANVLNFVIRNLDNVLIARFRGAIELGLYDRGYRLMMLPLDNINGPISRVMVPLLSRLTDEPARYRRAFLLTTRGILTVSLPGIAVGAALSDQIIPLLLGEKWRAASSIFFWLSLMGLIQPLGNVMGWLFISSGRARELFLWSVVSSVITAIGFVIGVTGWGAVGVAASLFVTMALRLPFLLSYARVGTSVRTRDLWLLMTQPAIMGVAAWAVTLACRTVLSGWPLLLASLLASYIAAGVISSCTREGRELMSQLATHATSRLPRFRAKMPA